MVLELLALLAALLAVLLAKIYFKQQYWQKMGIMVCIK